MTWQALESEWREALKNNLVGQDLLERMNNAFRSDTCPNGHRAPFNGQYHKWNEWKQDAARVITKDGTDPAQVKDYLTALYDIGDTVWWYHTKLWPMKDMLTSYEHWYAQNQVRPTDDGMCPACKAKAFYDTCSFRGTKTPWTLEPAPLANANATAHAFTF